MEETPHPVTQDFMTEEELPAVDKADTTPVTLLVDTRNGFNELGRKTMLWTVWHTWAAGAGFACNCYRHAAQLIVRRAGGACFVISLEEGVTQGDPLSMILYSLALAPLAKEKIREAVPGAMQAWYTDDCTMAGEMGPVAEGMNLLERLGPARGYFLEPAKSILISSPAEMAAAKAALSRFNFRYQEGARYVGGFIGTEDAKKAWLEPKIAQWVEGIHALARITLHYPQTAYAGLSKSLIVEWQYMHQVIENAGDHFAPIEDALSSIYLLYRALKLILFPSAIRRLILFVNACIRLLITCSILFCILILHNIWLMPMRALMTLLLLLLRSHALCATVYHNLGLSPGAIVFSRDMLLDIPLSLISSNSVKNVKPSLIITSAVRTIVDATLTILLATTFLKSSRWVSVSSLASVV